MKKHFNEPEPSTHLYENKAVKSKEVNAPLLRYSDSELIEFKELILSQVNEATAEYELLNRTLLRYATNKKQPVTFLLKEDDTEVYSIYEIAQLATSMTKHINALQKALLRIENKTFGICRITGKLIAKDRLMKAPVTTICTDENNLVNCLN